MSIGTARPNFFHRLGHAWDAFKAASISPGELYPPQPNRGMSTGWINWQGWDAFEKQSQTEGQRDLQRAKTAVTSPWVFADVQAIANEFSTSELIVKERRGDKLEDVDNHPLELIWESPNEHMGRSFVTAFWAWSYVLASKSYLYWVPDTSGTELMEVWPVPPWMITPIPDKDEFIRGYAFKANQYADTIVIPPELITYSHSVNLFNVRDGLSAQSAFDTDMRADLAASVWNLNFFDENNGIPDGALMMSADALDQDVERVRMELKGFFGGTKRGIVVGRSKDLTWQEYGRSQKDMEFSQQREFASKVIGRTLGFPDGYWSDLANRANAEQARRTMISGAVWPLLVRLSEDMNAARRGVVQRWYGPDTRVEFKDIRLEDKEAKRAELAAYTPFVTVNELREMVGQEALDNDDPRGLMLVAEITKGVPLPGTPAALLLEDLQAKKDEQAAQEQAALVEQGQAELPPEETSQEEVPPEEAPAPEELSPEFGAGKAMVDCILCGDTFPLGSKCISCGSKLDKELWERKALKRFKVTGKVAVGFESDSIDTDEHERISAALKAAQDVQAIKAAFKATAMDDTAERALATAIRKALAKQSAATIDAIEAGDQPALDMFGKAIRAELQPALVQAMLESIDTQSTALGVAFDPANATALAQKWADSYVPELIKGLTDTTKQIVKGTITQFRSDPKMTRADLVKSMSGAFGADRADMIATTELGRAASQAAREVNGYLREHGLDYQYIWQTANDDLTCPICAPLNGTVVESDDLPPAHPRCRCTVTQRRVDNVQS